MAKTASGIDKTSENFDPFDEMLAEYFTAGYQSRQSDADEEDRARKTRNTYLAEQRFAAEQRGRARRDAEREQRALASPPRRSRGSAVARNVTGGSAPVSAPSFSARGGSSSGVSRETSSRVIIAIMVFAGIGVIANQATKTVPQKQQITVGNETVPVPAYLPQVGGVFIAGVIALIVNEVSPGLGLALGIVLGLDVFLGKTGLISGLSNNLFGKMNTSSVASGTQAIGGLPFNAPGGAGSNVPSPQHGPGAKTSKGTLYPVGPAGPTGPKQSKENPIRKGGSAAQWWNIITSGLPF